MAGRLVMKNTFLELEMSLEESEFAVQQHRRRAHTDTCAYLSFTSTDLGSFKSSDVCVSPRSTVMGSSLASSSGSAAGDASDRWADICDSDDDEPTPSFSSRASSPPGTWSSPPGTWSSPPSPLLLPQSNVATDGRTTLVVKNLPAGCTQDELLRILGEVGLAGLYNFVYIPFDFKKSVFYRYGFVNFEQHEQAVKAMEILDGFYECVVDGESGCEVEWSGQQSLPALIERYRNCPVMHSTVPVAYKPFLFERGVRVAFPAPTRDVEPPKHLKSNMILAQTPEVQSQPLPATHDPRTTIVVKNLPEGCTQDGLRRILDDVQLGGWYNFIYVPYDFKKRAALRYGFVSFEQHEQAVKASAILDGLMLGEKSCEVQWGDAQQSLHVNIERYRNSPLMHNSVPEAYKPVLFERGVRVAFPPPTKMVKPLKLRRVQQS